MEWSNEQQQKYARQMQYEYSEHGEIKLEKLQKLDRQVKRPAEIFTYFFGIVGALVLGVGMCLAMEVIGDLMIPGIVIGVVGIVMVAVNYPIYRAIVKSRKQKYSAEVLRLTDDLLNK